MKKLLSLVKLQLADKIDFSWTKDTRSIIVKVVLAILKFVLVTALFYVLFMVCSILGVFGLSKNIPDTVLTVIFTIIQLLSVISCMAGLTNTLYKSEDNKVLLTLPVEHNQVFFSKIILYYIYELLKNINFTLPLFIAYGLNNGAVFYYYPYLLKNSELTASCFRFVANRFGYTCIHKHISNISISGFFSIVGHYSVFSPPF